MGGIRAMKWTWFVIWIVSSCYNSFILAEETRSTLGTCSSKGSDGNDGICDPGEENKYKKDKNLDNYASTASFLDEKLRDLEFKNTSSTSNNSAATGQEASEAWPKLQIPVLDGVKVGHVQEVEVTPGVKRQIKTLSMRPPIFEIPDFLAPLECDFITALAERKGLGPNDKATHNEGVTFEDPENTFTNWDYNGDGFIDAQEIVLLPGKIDLKFDEKDAKKMFLELGMDKDNNGKIDLEELKNTELSKIKEYFLERLQDNDQRRNATSTQAWLWHDDDELLRYQPDLMDRFHERLEAITKIPKEIIEESEPLQVLKYNQGSYHYCQQDSEPNVVQIPCCQYGDTKQCRLCRFISVAYFLNDVENGGEIVFPLANSKFEDDIMHNTGNWTGFFTYSKTTGSRTAFDVHLTFRTDGANKVLQGNGTDEGGQFEFTDSLVAENIVRFRKRYVDMRPEEPVHTIKYAGRIKGGSTIEGLWWVPGHPRMHGKFFMYYKKYDKWVDRQLQKCDTSAYCPKASLSIKPKKGTALMWYNHNTNKDGWIGSLDDKCYFGNCDVIRGDKWIATSWINVIGDGNTTLRAWRSGKNWLSVLNRAKHTDMLAKMKREKKHEETDVIQEAFMKDMKEKKNFAPTENRQPERHVLNAVTSLLNKLNDQGIRDVSKKIHEKLSMTCIPLVLNHEGKIRVVDGSTE
ncbi:predicted protein [Nematostella vectensis]|uniref:EF-hand domain-containing protein n=1 Tax=Nematostella vectensis TaxID=45351 RepID=A7RK78_NEMVE|nr:predicted protein [Nematostella vectensis]|eukprot:XP_001640263.1 predicted protein [Nematostella vectensis]